jgi:protein-S-isoprenylcysteine O-methyltransferase Ste14
MSRLTIIFLVMVTPVLAICLALLGLATIPTNPLGWFLLLTGIVYTAGTVIFTVIRRQRFWEARAGGGTIQEERGDRSFWLITLGMMAVFYLSPMEYIYSVAWLPRTVWTKFCGVGLVVAGSVLFVWARRTLGASYSGHVSVKKGQELVQSGPYRYIRHPAYAGYLLMALGISLGYSSLAGLISILVLLLPSLVYRMNVEEKLLNEHFGEAYRQHASRVKRLIPGVW